MIRRKAAPLSVPKSAPLEAMLSAILAEHFDNCENPHRTIDRIRLLLDAPSRPKPAAEPAHRPSRTGPTYN